ncbi:hypothetical protein AURDEDRAFT_170328 [Auricularia subglabra TFB-10046 SS5]|nr:hypothetical protein AURDEDRAFT_170328 [Auricularia subglabra TFB-10046 SS5]
MSELVRAVVAAVSAAGADAAQAWNLKQRRAISQRLPPEVLGNCFRMLWLRELVRITHVCRRWRAVALAERELWATYSRKFVAFPHKGLVQLSAMLERSRPVPFRLRMVYEYPDIDESLLVALIRPELWRLREYQGPSQVFLAAHADGIVMQHLQSFDCDEGYSIGAPFKLPSFLAETNAPKLQSARLPEFSLDGTSTIFRNLRSLFCCFPKDPDSIRLLFRHCPRLVSLQLASVLQGCVLPQCPLPVSLREVYLSPERRGYGQSRVEYQPILEPWIGQRLPSLRVDGAMSYTSPFLVFLASHDEDVHAHVESWRICLTCESSPDHRYDIRGHSGDGLAAQTFHTSRITALSLSVGTLMKFFGERHHIPRLDLFKLVVNDKPDRGWPTVGSQAKYYYVKTPRLQQFVVVISRYTAFEHERHVARVAQNFLGSLRSWIRYDAPELESITAHGPPACVQQHIGPLELGRLARRYIVGASEMGGPHYFPHWPEPPERILPD